MKKFFLLAGIAAASFASAIAQPTLTAATNNPVAGDMFYGHLCDTAGVTPGATGAAVTWNFSTLAITSGYNPDTISFVSCSVAPDCGTFPGSNLAIMSSSSDFSYLKASTTGLSLLGYVSGPFSATYLSGKDIFYYPLTYNSTHTDTSAMDNMGFDLERTSDSMIYDGYGTLILPTGTFTNAVRVHKVTVTRDSSYSGTTLDVTVNATEDYSWYVSGFHFPLLQITIDTAYGNSVEYYEHGVPLGTGRIAALPGNMQVFPNPATHDVHIAFNIASTRDAVVSISDLTGSVVAVVNGDRMTAGANEIAVPVSNLPAGMYIVQLKSAEGVMAKKVVVSH